MPPPRRPELYELTSLLHQIDEEGFVVIHRDKLLRLLGKGNEAAGTWTSLIEVWEETGEEAALVMGRLPANRFIFTKATLKLKPVKGMTS